MHPFMLDEPTPADPRLDWDQLDQAARDAAYDNGRGVANSAAQMEARDRESATYRAAHSDHLDIPYGPSTRDAFACFAEGPAAAGWSGAMLGYTLAPEVSLAGIVAEIGAAHDWLGAHGAEHGIAGPVVLAGWSARAQLAACNLGHPRVAASLAVSGVYELTPIRETYLNAALGLTDAEIADLSPLRLPVVAEPMTVAYGTRELPALVHDARRFHAMRSAAHALGPLLPVAGADHFSILDGFRRPDGPLVRAARDLLRGTA